MFKNLKIIDYVMMPLLIIMLLAEPNILRGVIDPLEMSHYLSAANGIFEGKIPFVDFLMFFGPLQLYSIVIAMIIFGKTILVLKMFLYVNYILSFLVIYLLAMNLYKNKFCAYFISLVCVIEASHPFWATGYDYGRMGLGILVLFLLVRFINKEKMKILLWAGVASGIALFYTSDMGIFSVISSVASIFIYTVSKKPVNLKDSAKYFFRRTSHYTAGILLIAIPFFIFLFSQGALIPYLKTAFYIMPKYHIKIWGQPIVLFSWALVQDPFLLLRSHIFKIYMPILIYTVICLYLCYSFLKKRWNKESTIISLLFIYGVLVYKTSFRAMAGPQFIVSLPPLIILIGMFCEKALNMLTSKTCETNTSIKRSRIVVATLILFISAAYFIGSSKGYYGTLTGWIKYQTYKQYFSATWTGPVLFDEANFAKPRIERAGNIMVPKQQADEMETVAAYLKDNTKNGEEVLAFPEYSFYNFLADRPVFSRFYPAGLAWTTPQWRSEILNELIVKIPKIILCSTNVSVLARSTGRSTEILPLVIEFISKNYHITKKINNVIIYEKNSPAGKSR